MSTLVARWLALPPNLRGILWVGLSGFLFALLNVFTLIPAQHLNSYVMAFLRYCAGTLILMPFIVRLGPYRALHSNRKGLHVARGVIHACGMFLWFAALPLTSLAEITALGFTGPIFVTIGAALFLGEDVRLRRWAAVLVGFGGAMIIIRPGFTEIGVGALCVLISTPIFSASNLISKALARTDGAETIVIWQHLVIVCCSAPVALWFWQTPDWTDLLWFLRRACAARWATSASNAAIRSPRSRCSSPSASCRCCGTRCWASFCSASSPTSGPSSALP